ncbi:MAG: hypothetical protein ACLQMS_09665 [Desulfomonilaceae bacterium]
MYHLTNTLFIPDYDVAISGAIISSVAFVSIPISDTGTAYNFYVAPKETPWVMNVKTSSPMIIEVISPMVVVTAPMMVVMNIRMMMATTMVVVMMVVVMASTVVRVATASVVMCRINISANEKNPVTNCLQ